MCPYVPRWRHARIVWVKVESIPVQCPYCGYEWVYTGSDKHYATCPGMVETTWPDGRPWTWKCDKKVRLHRYLIRTKKRPMNKLKYPNENYERWWEK